MIFDGETVTQLVVEWQRTQDSSLIGEILNESEKLIEAIVSSYDPCLRDDLIQESRLRIQKALVYYNPEYSVHNYFTTIIHNICRTYVRKQFREAELPEDFEYTPDEEEEPDRNVLSDLITRNRQRFPSLPCNDIDDITECIYTMLNEGLYNKPRSAVSKISIKFAIPRNIANALYCSTLYWLRMQYISNADHNSDADEFSILPDIKEALGETAYKKITVLFSGMYVKLP